MLKQFGTSEDVELLREPLRDSSREVVRGALSAIDTLLAEEGADASSVLGTLKGMLTQGDASTQIDVAATLHRLGHTEGTDALRRLAASNDPSAKVYVAKTVSGLGDSAFVPILIHFLGDTNGTVRNEALKGLPKLAGQDIGGGGSTQQQIERWKAWVKK
jgi:HEAT repeat protein